MTLKYDKVTIWYIQNKSIYSIQTYKNDKNDHVTRYKNLQFVQNIQNHLYKCILTPYEDFQLDYLSIIQVVIIPIYESRYKIKGTNLSWSL